MLEKIVVFQKKKPDSNNCINQTESKLMWLNVISKIIEKQVSWLFFLSFFHTV